MGRIEKINEIVAEYCAEIIREPLIFFSEADLQALLYKHLITTNHFGKYFDTKYQKGYGSKSVYKTTLVHREYGINNMPNSRVDLAVFDKDEVKKINHPNLTYYKEDDKKDEYLTPLAAFELGTEKTHDFSGHITNDLEKLKELVGQGMQRGYYIHFFRDKTVSAADTARRELTEERIEREFRNVVKDIKPVENINVLLFLIRIYRKNQEKIWGKCEVFNVEEQKWEKVNIDQYKEELENKILQILK